MLKITVMPPDGESYTQHFYSIEKAKSFLGRLIEQSGGAAQQSVHLTELCSCTHDVYESILRPGHCHVCGKPLRK